MRVSPATKARESRVGAVFAALFSLAIVVLWAAKARKHDPRDLSRLRPAAPSVATAGPAPAQLELALSASPERVDEIGRALAPAVKRSAVCMGGVYGRALVEVVFAPSGEATEARFAATNTLPVAALFQDTCVLKELRAARIAPSASALTASFTVWNFPTAGSPPSTP
jgi:hypothetical protein